MKYLRVNIPRWITIEDRIRQEYRQYTKKLVEEIFEKFISMSDKEFYDRYIKIQGKKKIKKMWSKYLTENKISMIKIGSIYTINGKRLQRAMQTHMNRFISKKHF